MGCHTWFYRKVEDPSVDKMMSTIEDRIERELTFLEKLINDRDSIDAELLECYSDWTPEWAVKNREFWTQLSMFLKGEAELRDSDKRKFWMHIDVDNQNTELNNDKRESILKQLYSTWSDELYIEGRGFFVDDTGYHDEFRKYGYPNDLLFSLEETLAYIDDPKNKCFVSDREWTEKRLKEFWEKHPDGMIQFG